ncbi:hypothetical protein N9917_01825 [Deltaproteobacteria bacterium]|nr:hypothetical protein [Deltaproteobacteria bacterium]
MRYVHGLVCVCALLVAMPLSASAQDSEEDGSWLERWHPEALEDPAKPAPEPASEEPALELKLDADGVQVTPSQPRTVDGYTLEEMELRVKRAKIGLGVSVGAFMLGSVMAAVAVAEWVPGFYASSYPPHPAWVAPVGWTGVVLMTGGLVGIVTAGTLRRRRTRDRDSLRPAHHARPHPVQWDPAQSRLVF